MASKNIKIRRRTTTGIDILYPETKAEQIRVSEDVDISAAAENIIKMPAAVTTPKYIKVATDGTLSYGDTPAFFGAVASDHSHIISDILAEFPGEGDLTLQQMLDAKVPIINGKIPAQYWPTWTAGHMKFITSIVLAGETLTTLASIYTSLDTEATDDLNIGNYGVVTTAGRVNTDATHLLLGADDGEEVMPYLEVGDWIVLVNYVSATSTYTFAVVSNQHELASTAKTGIIKVADATGKTKRSDLSDVSNAEKVASEGLLRAVLKNIELVGDIIDVQVSSPVHRIIAAGLTHTSGDVTNNVVGTLNEFVVCADLDHVYECTVVSAPNYTWTYRNTIAAGIPVNGFEQGKLYFFSLTNELRYAQNATPYETPLPLYPADTNDIFFEE